MDSGLWHWILGGLVLCIFLRCACWIKSPAAPRTRQAASRCQLGLVLIFQDQEAHVEGIIRHLLSVTPVLAERGMELTLVVVDNRSRDRSPLIIERLLRRHRELRFIRLEPGANTRESPVEVGLALCPGPLALVVDLHAPLDVPGLLQALSCLAGLGSPHSSGGDGQSRG